MKVTNVIYRYVLAGVLSAGLAATAQAGSHEAPMRELADSMVKAWITDPVVIEAIKSQNQKYAGLKQAEIADLDTQWRAETGASTRPLIDSVLSNQLSTFLSDAKNQANGLVTEIFVMDDKGLNVGQSDVTSDFWQGDEAKWQKTYQAGPNAIFIDDVEKDESTQTFQSQLSMSVADPASGQVIGAITVGVNVDAL